MQTKKNIFLWVLYDFANSVVSIVFFLYFAQWVVIDKGVSDVYFNATFTISAILLLLTAPLTGLILDKYAKRIPGLRVSTVLTSFLYALCSLLSVSNHEIAALVVFSLALYVYLLSFTFYTPLINDISHPNKRGLVSGLGIGASYLGQIVGLIIALPFSTGALTLFGSTPRAEALLPSVMVFTLLSLPMLIFFKENDRPAVTFRLTKELKNLKQETGKILTSRVGLFLLAYFLFNDALLTASNNFPIFLEQVWKVSDTTKTYILLGILLTSAVGGWLSGVLADKFGHKRTLVFITTGWIFILPFLGFITNFKLFVCATVVMGLWFGSNWAVSRSVMSHLSPEKGHNLAFAYFGLVERASSFVGPVVWSITLVSLSDIGPDKYRFAILSITGFVILGLIALVKVKDK